MRAHQVFGIPCLSLAMAFVAATAPPASAAGPGQAGTSGATQSLLAGVELFQADVLDSPIEFSVVSMGISKVRGTFTDFSETLALDRADLTRSSVSVVIRTNSLTTFNPHRDHDLKSADWFDVDKYPIAAFSSREIVRQGEGYVMRGGLTLHGVTREVAIPFAFNGWLRNVYGGDWAGFEGHVVLNRKDYGIVGPASSNVLLQLGKASVGDEVELRLAVEANRLLPADTIREHGADSLWQAIVARGVPAVVKDLRARRSASADSLVPVTEARMNLVGWQLVERGRPLDALELFKLQAEAYPRSGSGQTGMAYAYATLGDRDRARASAEQALALNPGATRAMEILRRVRGNT